jgi:hypothetical protein
MLSRLIKEKIKLSAREDNKGELVPGHLDEFLVNLHAKKSFIISPESSKVDKEILKSVSYLILFISNLR